MSPTSQNENKTLHIVMFPWFAVSHLTSFLRLSNKLAQHGIKTSFFLPNNTLPKLSPHNHHPDHITFFPITVPSVSGLPTRAESTNDILASDMPLLASAFDLTKDTMDRYLAELKPDFVFFDFAYWMPELARKHGAKSLYNVTSNVAGLVYVTLPSRDLPIDHVLTVADLIYPPPGFPNAKMRLRAVDARSMFKMLGIEFGSGITLVHRFNLSMKECDAIGSKTCREMEGAYCDLLEKHMGKPVILSGPMIPDPPKSTLDHRFDNWLNGFDKCTVVFCALGSECVLSKDAFHELVLGLELTGMPFLATLKPPLEHETIESALPEGFSERTKGRGIVHGGWVQQPLILQHRSLGCFVTHCGVSSLSEAILSECQLVLLPQAADQFVNAKLMSMDFKVGIEVEKKEDDNYFTKEDICKAITTVMKEESDVGKEIRSNHAKWKQVLLKEGLEESYIKGFIQGLKDLIE